MNLPEKKYIASFDIDAQNTFTPVCPDELAVAEDGEITGFRMRIEQSKLSTVKALQSIGFETIASGDSYNDLGMIRASKAGFLFKSTDQIKNDNPDLPAYETYEELLAAIKAAV